MSKVRQIGEKILHTKAKVFRFGKDSGLEEQFEIMRAVLHDAHGVGIAANQCADIKIPFQLIIVGNHDPKSRFYSQQRYPGREIPDEIMMVNPRIILKSGEVYYPGEGCLSINGGLRGAVKRYPRIMVNYEDENGKPHENEYLGFTAHIIQHEVDHLSGKVFLQEIIDELDNTQLQILLKYIEKQEKEINKDKVEVMPTPTVVFKRDGHNKLKIEEEVLQQQLAVIASETLEVIKNMVRKAKA